MKIRRLTWRSYRIPLRRAFVTSAGAQALREGLIVRLETDSGLHGLGEIAPLRAYATRAAAHWLAMLEPQIRGMDPDDVARVISRLEAPQEIQAAIGCGLDVAACDLLGRETGLPVAQILGGRRRPLVPVNATISADTPDAAARLARQAVEGGFGCVKLKVGMMGSAAAECDLVAAVREAAGSGVLIRVDANQAWEPSQAIENIRAMQRFGIEFAEQPVAADDIEGMRAVREAAGVPIAADEAVTSLPAAHAIIKAGAADVLVIKPMVVGGLRAALEIIRLAAANRIESVVTTSIDSGVGIAAALHLAASFQGRFACGLATAELLECDLTASTLEVHDGHMACPDRPGLGVEIDESKAAAYLDRP